MAATEQQEVFKDKACCSHRFRNNKHSDKVQRLPLPPEAVLHVQFHAWQAHPRPSRSVTTYCSHA